MIRQHLYKYIKKFDQFKLNLKKKYNLFDPFIIFPYRGYANDRQMLISGRVLEKEGILKKNNEPDHIGDKLLYMFRRYESDEIPFVEIEADFEGMKKTVVADEEGYFNLQMDLDHPLEAAGSYWRKILFRLLDNPYTDQKQLRAEGSVLIPGRQSKFAIVSDVDDTIIKSHATDTFLKVKTLLLNTATSRVPFEGVDSFYRALQRHREAFNPLFFVLGSTWNIYDLLVRFCEIHGIPPAPFFLKELGLTPDSWLRKDTVAFKLERIKHLMSFYGDLSFVFIGDSGQKDPEIYHQVCMAFPDRVKGVYIRKLHRKQLSDSRKKLVDELKEKGIDMLFMENTKEAGKHAVRMGLIEN